MSSRVGNSAISDRWRSQTGSFASPPRDGFAISLLVQVQPYAEGYSNCHRWQTVRRDS